MKTRYCIVCKIFLTSILLFVLDMNCLSQQNPISFKISGFSDFYKSKFEENKDVLYEAINNLELPNSCFPIRVSVDYHGKNGLISLSLNYVHDDFFQMSRNKRFNDNWRKSLEGINIFFVHELTQCLNTYIYNVSKNGLIIDKELLKISNCIVLINNDDVVKFFSINYFDKNIGAVTYAFSSNVNLRYNGVDYIVRPIPEDLFIVNKFFGIGRTIGLDGNKTEYFYFSKFFKIDEWDEENKLKIDLAEIEKQKRDSLQIVEIARVSFSLTGRSSVLLTKPNYPGNNEEGTVVVEITVDRNGKVTNAVAGVKGTTNLNASLLSAAKTAALSTKFSENLESPALQTGTITYKFVINR